MSPTAGDGARGAGVDGLPDGVVALVPMLGGADALGWLELHGRPLYVHAARAVVAATGGAALVSAAVADVARVRAALDAADLDVPVIEGGSELGAGLGAVLGAVLAGVVAAGSRAVLVHDPFCPLVPARHVADVLAESLQAPGDVIVSTRPMTDTVKSVVDGFVHATVDRERLQVLSSPVVVPAARLRALPELAGCADLEVLLDALRAVGAPVRWTPAPASARRVGSAADVAVLEALSERAPAAAAPGSGRPRT